MRAPPPCDRQTDDKGMHMSGMGCASGRLPFRQRIASHRLVPRSFLFFGCRCFPAAAPSPSPLAPMDAVTRSHPGPMFHQRTPTIVAHILFLRSPSPLLRGGSRLFVRLRRLQQAIALVLQSSRKIKTTFIYMNHTIINNFSAQICFFKFGAVQGERQRVGKKRTIAKPDFLF